MSDNFQMTQFDDTCQLDISRAYVADAGEYTCVARNSGGMVSCSAVLMVNGMCQHFRFLTLFFFIDFRNLTFFFVCFFGMLYCLIQVLNVMTDLQGINSGLFVIGNSLDFGFHNNVVP